MRLVLLGGIAGYVGTMFLIATVGPIWGCWILGFTFGGAYCAHNERSKWLVGLFLKAIDAHMQRKEAASIMGVQQAQISRWESGTEQASLNRLAQLPNEVLAAAVIPFLQDIGYAVAPRGPLASAAAAVMEFAAAVKAPSPATRPRQEVA